MTGFFATLNEMIEHGIRVNAIGAAEVVTNLFNQLMEDGLGFLQKHGNSAKIGHAASPD